MSNRPRYEFPLLRDRKDAGHLALEQTPCPICGDAEGDVAASGPDYHYACSQDNFSFHRCRTCGLWWLNPRPSAEDIPHIYPSHYYSYEADKKNIVSLVWDRIEQRKIKRYFDEIKTPPASDHAVFEIGCGSGRFLRILRKASPSNWRVMGADLDPRAIAMAQDLKGIKAHLGTFETLGLPDNAFDMVISQQVIEHVPNPDMVIREAYRCLKPGGILVLETPNVDGIDRRLFNKSLWGGYHFPRHFTLFSPTTLEMLVKKHGFESVHSRQMLSVTFWIVTFRNFLTAHPLLHKLFAWVHQRNPLCLALSTSLELCRQLTGIRSTNMAFIAKVGDKDQRRSEQPWPDTPH